MTDNIEDAFTLRYQDLRRLARARLAREQAAISTGTLTHELYLTLQSRDDLRFGSRLEFLGYAARAMRTLLVDMARARLAAKRDAELVPLTQGLEVADATSARPEQVLAAQRAFERLAKASPRLAQVADLRAMAGLSLAEIASLLDLSVPTVKRDWRCARAFLVDALQDA